LEITSNYFHILPIHNYRGLYLDNVNNGFHIEANTFEGDYIQNANYGLVIEKTGANINLVYNNRFSNLYYATSLQDQNRIPNSYDGLCIKCNDFDHNYFDIFPSALASLSEA